MNIRAFYPNLFVVIVVRILTICCLPLLFCCQKMQNKRSKPEVDYLDSFAGYSAEGKASKVIAIAVDLPSVFILFLAITF